MRHPFHVYTREGSPVWWYDFRLKGRRFRGPTEVPKEHHRREAEKEAGAAWLRECHREGVAVDSPQGEFDTLKLIEDYVDSELAVRAKTKGPRYADQIETDLVRAAARFPAISQITTDSWTQALEEWRSGKDAIGPRSCQRITASLRPFLRWCVKRKAIPFAPELEAPSDEDVAAVQAERRPFTVDERDRFLREIRKLNLRAWHIYTILLYSGLRKSGLERVLGRWVDFKGGWLTMPPAAQKRGKKARRFKLHPKALASLRALSGPAPDPGKPIVGPFDYDGHGRRDGERAGLFWKALRAAGIDPHGITAHHVTRHTACTIAGNSGASLRELMALGGWATPAMAMRYCHDEDAVAERAVERL